MIQLQLIGIIGLLFERVGNLFSLFVVEDEKI